MIYKFTLHGKEFKFNGKFNCQTSAIIDSSSGECRSSSMNYKHTNLQYESYLVDQRKDDKKYVVWVDSLRLNMAIERMTKYFNIDFPSFDNIRSMIVSDMRTKSLNSILTDD